MIPFWKFNGAKSFIIEKELQKKNEWRKCGKSEPELQNNIKNGILLPKLFWPTVRKSCSSDWDFFFQIQDQRPRIRQILRSKELFS